MIFAPILITLSLMTTLPRSSTGVQECLHKDSVDPQQIARRRAAISIIRLINTIEARENAAGRPFRQLGMLASTDYCQAQKAARQDTPDLSALSTTAPGWKVRLDVFQGGYWLALADATDPCGFTYVTNQEGVILRSEPIQ